MPAGQVARALDVRVVGVDLDVLVAGHARREVLVVWRCRVRAGLGSVRSAVDGVVDRLAHVRVRKQRA